MDISHAVSQTALVTLKARAVETQRQRPLIDDPMGVKLLGLLERRLAYETRAQLFGRSLPASLSTHLAMRGRQYDRFTAQFRATHANALVVSLGAGFDTRYFRISPEPWPYIEVDLPEVVAAKRALLEELTDGAANYPLIGCSVLDNHWIDQVRARQTKHVLLLAEGLFMYLPKPQVIELFGRVAAAFDDSEIVFEVVNERYTRGLFKKMVAAKMRRKLGTKEEATFEYGVRTPNEIEDYADEVKLLDEWSYLHEPDLRPWILRLLRFFKFATRSQWTLRASLGGKRGLR
jgi:methyltransferase (TIGR00027 family)